MPSVPKVKQVTLTVELEDGTTQTYQSTHRVSNDGVEVKFDRKVLNGQIFYDPEGGGTEDLEQTVRVTWVEQWTEYHR